MPFNTLTTGAIFGLTFFSSVIQQRIILFLVRELAARHQFQLIRMLQIIWNAFALLNISATLETVPLMSSEWFSIIILNRFLHMFIPSNWMSVGREKNQQKTLLFDPVSWLTLNHSSIWNKLTFTHPQGGINGHKNFFWVNTESAIWNPLSRDIMFPSTLVNVFWVSNVFFIWKEKKISSRFCQKLTFETLVNIHHISWVHRMDYSKLFRSLWIWLEIM